MHTRMYYSCTRAETKQQEEEAAERLRTEHTHTHTRTHTHTHTHRGRRTALHIFIHRVHVTRLSVSQEDGEQSWFILYLMVLKGFYCSEIRLLFCFFQFLFFPCLSFYSFTMDALTASESFPSYTFYYRECSHANAARHTLHSPAPVGPEQTFWQTLEPSTCSQNCPRELPFNAPGARCSQLLSWKHIIISIIIIIRIILSSAKASLSLSLCFQVSLPLRRNARISRPRIVYSSASYSISHN